MLNRNIFKVLEVKTQELWQLKDIKNYLRISDNYDDNLITTLTDTAIIAAENFTNLALLTRVIEYTSYRSITQKICLKYKPIQKIVQIKFVVENVETIVENSEYQLDIESNTIYLKQKLATDKLVISYLSGFTILDIPSPLRHGILLHIAEMYDRDSSDNRPFSTAIKNLYLPYKQLRI